MKYENAGYKRFVTLIVLITVFLSFGFYEITAEDNDVVLSTHKAADGFSIAQGRNNWYYMEWTGTEYRKLETAIDDFWRGSEAAMRLGRTNVHPANSFDPVRAFCAPSAGILKISGTISSAELIICFERTNQFTIKMIDYF